MIDVQDVQRDKAFECMQKSTFKVLEERKLVKCDKTKEINREKLEKLYTKMLDDFSYYGVNFIEPYVKELKNILGK